MKKIWNSIKTILLTYLIQYAVIVIGIVAYIAISGNINLLDDVNNIYKYIIIGVTLTSIPIASYLYKKYKIKEKRIELNKLLYMIPLGIGVSFTYNMLVFELIKNKEIADLNILIVILYTGIIGPLFEEIVFRYVSLRKANELYNTKIAVIIISLVFALLHSGIINIIYAFIIGIILSYIYIKKENILYPIIIHISANITSIFITGYNTYLLLIGIILLATSIYLFLKRK